LSILQSLGGSDSIQEIEQQVSGMQTYLQQYNDDQHDVDDDDDNCHYHKATMELMQAFIQVLLTAATSTTTPKAASSTRHNLDFDDEDDDESDYCLLLSDDEIDELVDKLSSIPNVKVHGDACRQIMIRQGRGVVAIMVLASQVLLYHQSTDKIDSDEQAFFSFVSKADNNWNTNRQR
jgi:hypothetical protein